MSIGEILLILKWWLVLLGIGVSFLPLTFTLFPNFKDRGYIFSKILGIGVISYLFFLLGTFHILSFSRINLIVVLFLLFLANYFFLIKKNKKLNLTIIHGLKIIFLEEVIFLICLAGWSFIRGFQPDIQGLEKFMDYGFINSLLRSDYFPSKDIWYTPLHINYYYFGHLATSALTKISGIAPAITFNLMIASLFAFTFVGSFSIGINLITFGKKLNTKRHSLYIILTGFLTAFLVSLSGNLHTIYTLFESYGPTPVPFWKLGFSIDLFPNSYWYPNATRFIYNTIHEFPSYSFVVSDLHGHLLDVPFVLLAIAVLLSLTLKSQITKNKQISNHKDANLSNGISKPETWKLIGNWLASLPASPGLGGRSGNLEIGNSLLLGFLLAIMYMTNAWDGLIYLGLTFIVLAYIGVERGHKSFLLKFVFILLAFFVFALPFNINFKPFASGIGILCLPEFVTNFGKIGPFLFEENHCQRSPVWQLFILHGFFGFFFTFFALFIRKKLQTSSDIFVLLLIAFSILLIIIPEFIYVKDIYPDHYRANTMFKFTYQAFIMLSISTGYIFLRLAADVKRYFWKRKIFNFYFLFLIFAFSFLILVMIYPYFAVKAYYNNLNDYKGIDGTAYIKRLYPSDYEAISWINKNIKDQPVILEAQGDSYTDFARVSANTGLPTVLGWTVHEWLWRGNYDIAAPRIKDIQDLYESEDLELTKRLINKYDIKYVFMGVLERQKYTLLKEAKFEKLGDVVFKSGTTKIYKINK